MPFRETAQKVKVVAITGSTNSGKTTLAKGLAQYYGAAGIVHQDDFFRPESDTSHVTVKGFINWEATGALNIPEFLNAVSKAVEIADQAAGDTARPSLVLIEGLHILDLELDTAQSAGGWDIDRIVFLDCDRAVCQQRRQSRWYGSSDPEWYFEECLWPAHERQVELAIQAAERTIHGRETILFVDANRSIDEVLADVTTKLGPAP